MTQQTLDTIRLDKGGHTSFDAGVCLLEAVAWFAGEEHSDNPQCTSPVLGAYGRVLNDVLPDGQRQLLVPFVPRMVGTAGDGLDEVRGYLALDWLIRVYTPAWLRLVPALAADADLLAGYEPIRSLRDATAVGDAVRAAASHASAASEAASEAARVAARGAAWAAAGEAASEAARVAARGAAWAAAGVAASEAARAAARGAASEAAWAAAWVAAWAAAGVAASEAAGVALEPTIVQLQTSAIALLDAMIHPDVTPADNTDEARCGATDA